MNILRSSTKAIIKWIYNVKKIMSKASKMPRNDIRRYFEV